MKTGAMKSGIWFAGCNGTANVDSAEARRSYLLRSKADLERWRQSADFSWISISICPFCFHSCCSCLLLFLPPLSLHSDGDGDGKMETETGIGTEIEIETVRAAVSLSLSAAPSISVLLHG